MKKNAEISNISYLYKQMLSQTSKMLSGHSPAAEVSALAAAQDVSLSALSKIALYRASRFSTSMLAKAMRRKES